MLPQHADEHEDGGDKDERERDLADGSRGEGLDVALLAVLVGFLAPAGEGGEEEEADEGEDDGDNTACVYGVSQMNERLVVQDCGALCWEEVLGGGVGGGGL